MIDVSHISKSSTVLFILEFPLTYPDIPCMCSRVGLQLHFLRHLPTDGQKLLADRCRASELIQSNGKCG